MNKFYFFLFYSLLISIPAKAVTTKAELCSYDTDFCDSIFTSDGKIITVKPRINALLSELSDDIVSTSLKFGVDPRAVAGAIAAENTLNVQIDDDIQNFLANAGVHSVLGKKFSYGLGQIYPDTAIKVEPIVAKIEGRSPRTFDEVSAALVDPLESLKYAAAIVRDAQDQYKKVGIDISSNPAALATLYNLGEADKRAAGKGPDDVVRPNYFGVFVEGNLSTIQDAIGWSPEKGKYSPQFSLGGNGIIEKNYFRWRQEIFSSPNYCSTDGADKLGEINAVVTRQNYSSMTQARGSFKVLRAALDCDMKRWSMIQFESGQVGWIKNEEIEKNASESSSAKFRTGYRCSQKQRNCNQQIQQAGLKISGTSPTTVEAKSFDTTQQAGMDRFNRWCLSNHRNTGQSKNPSGVSSPWSGNSGTSERGETGEKIKITALLGRRLESDISKLKKDLEQRLGKKWSEISGFEKRLVENLESQFSKYYPSNFNDLSRYDLDNYRFNKTIYESTMRSFSDGEVSFMEYAENSSKKIVDYSYESSSSRSSPFIYNNHTFNARTKSDIIQGMKTSCPEYLEQSKIDYFVEYMEAYKFSGADARGFYEIKTQILNVCQLAEYSQGRNNGSFCDPDCSIQIEPSYGVEPVVIKKEDLPNAKISKDTAKSIIAKMLDYEYSSIGQLASGRYSRTQNVGEQSCNFDEVGTLEGLQKIADLDCVSEVLVPDRNFFSIIYAKENTLSKKTVFDSVDADKFTILMKGCPEEIQSIAEEPDETASSNESAQ